MKIGVYTDVHYCASSSLIRSNGNHYSARIENCIASVGWAENLFKNQNVDIVICLGDFFDKSVLNAEEISALKDIYFYLDKPHYFLVGNHEITKYDREFNTLNTLRFLPNTYIIDEPTQLDNICMLPYITEDSRKPLSDYFEYRENNIIFSHNDIAGIRYGAFLNETGFNIQEIKSNCKLFINGHLHNSQFIDAGETILNLGNLTGLNFSEDAFKYNHYACIIDTDNLNIDFYMNPHSYNFYKIEFDSNSTYNILNNAVITLRVKEADITNAKCFIDQNSDKIAAIRMIAVSDTNEMVEDIQFNKVDYLSTFTNFMMSKLEQTSILKDELKKITGE